MPSGLRRYQHARQIHYVTFTCYHRLQRLGTATQRSIFEQALERVRRWYGFYINGYVVMPEHVHLLVSEPERGELSTAIQIVKQIVSRRLGSGAGEPFWQRRYYDFNVWSTAKFVEKRVTFIGIQCGAAWWKGPKTGRGVAFAIMRLERKARWKSSPNGQLARESGWGYSRRCAGASRIKHSHPSPKAGERVGHPADRMGFHLGCPGN